MIRIEPKYIHQLGAASSHGDLRRLLQPAIELEHATLPPYLTALMSLKPEANSEVREILRTIVIEEMLHMCIAANVLNALGGAPKIDNPRFIPSYPGPLPMCVADGLTISLAAFSPTVAQDVFMAIEEPEDPIEFKLSGDHEPPPEKMTIGLFYAGIIEKLIDLGDPLPGEPSRQVTYPEFFGSSELQPIETVADAVAGLELIVAQGEGSSTSPLDPEGDLAHYFRFQELAVGRRLIRDTSAPHGYSFSGPAIDFHPGGVWPLQVDTRLDEVPAGTEQRQLAERFSRAYSRLLRGLHRTFNGEPAYIQETLSLMYDIKLVGERLVSLPFPGRPGVNVGPPFQYTAP